LPKAKPKINLETRRAIRTYVKQGYSANKIQKKLQKQHLGIRRKSLRAEIRKIKGKKPKVNRFKYTPKKYRKMTRGITYPRRKRRLDFFEKKIAGYSTVNGKPRRIQVYGNGRQLYRVMQLASKYPPKQQFLTIDASKLLRDPWKYLSKEERWDARPLIES